MAILKKKKKTKRLPHGICYVAVSERKIGMNSNLVRRNPLHMDEIIQLRSSQFLHQ